jgi:hypothetical protein
MSGNQFSGTLIREHDDTENFRFLRVSSKERVVGVPYDFEVSFGNLPELANVGEIHLINASVPNIMNNVSASIGNNTFTYTGTLAGPQQVIFTDGYYTTTEIINRLESEINLSIAPSTITVAQNATTGKLTFTVAGENITYDNTGLNFTVGFTAPIGPIGAVSAQALPSLNGSTMFYIHSQDISNNKTLINSGNGDINDINGAFSIPINVPYGVYQYYQGTERLDRIVYGRQGRHIKNFKITLRTNGGRLCTELTDNFEMVLVFKVIYN